MDVVRQRLQGRYVEHSGFIRQCARPALHDELVDHRQKGGQCFTRTGRRRHQHVLSRPDGRPRQGLRRRGRGKSPCEPGGYGGMKRFESAHKCRASKDEASYAATRKRTKIHSRVTAADPVSRTLRPCVTGFPTRFPDAARGATHRSNSTRAPDHTNIVEHSRRDFDHYVDILLPRGGSPHGIVRGMGGHADLVCPLAEQGPFYRHRFRRNGESRAGRGCRCEAVYACRGTATDATALRARRDDITHNAKGSTT